MKRKLLSVLIILSIIISTVVITYATESDDDINIAVASDLHYCLPEEKLEGEIDDEIFWYANRRAAMENESGFIIDEFLRQCSKNECDYVLISGDMADGGRREQKQHTDIAEKLTNFEKTTGKKVFVIDGNHDLGYDSETDVEDFKRIYASFGYDEALAVDENSCSYTADLDGKYRLIALDSCDHSVSTEDGLTSERMKWFKEQATQAKKDGKFIILMMHHNLLDHMPAQRILSRNFIVRNHFAYADIFANYGVKTVFTGHEHCSDVSAYTSTKGNKIYDFATTSLTMYPLQYRMVNYSDEKINYSVRTVDSIDTEALSKEVSGYTEKQLDLMNKGLNEYALKFLKAGVRYRLELSLSMEKIGLSEGDFFYNLVNTAVSGLTDILQMPLYGENSVSVLAKKYNIEIPQSDYKNAWDLATDIVAAHYAGGESLETDSTAITILLRTASLILHDDLSGIADKVFLKTANSLLSSFGLEPIASQLTQLGTKVFGYVTPGERFLLAVASPIIYEFTFDRDEVDDNSGELIGYSPKTSENSFESVIDNASSIIEKIIIYFRMIIEVII